MRTTKKKTAWSWGAVQAAIESHLVRHSAIYGYACTAAAAIALATCTSLPVHATMTPAQKCAGASHTKSVAVAAPTVKRGFVMPEHLAGRGVSTASRHGYGRGSAYPQGRRHGYGRVTTPTPTLCASHAKGGFFNVPVGA
jgi:hypothetical protein